MLPPLYYRIKPENIDDIIGQEHLISKDSIIRKSIEKKQPFSFILFGKPGVGKTTLAEAYAKSINAKYVKINASTSNKKEIIDAFNESLNYKPYILIIDEIHDLNKAKQDLFLPYVESGDIFLIGTTTSNPYFSLNKALRSRCHLLEVKQLNNNEIVEGLLKIIKKDNILNKNLNIDNNSLEYIANCSNGDFRFAINYLDLIFLKFDNKKITIDDVKSIIKVPNYIGDKDSSEHYDLVSALQKSIRGSDVDAALYYLNKLAIIQDLSSISRRLLITAYEDIGIANPNACMRCKLAIEAANEIGFPEAIIPLSVSVVELCLSPKSRQAYSASEKAMEYVTKYPCDVLDYLKYKPTNFAEEDKYPYDRPDLWNKIQYLPNIIKNYHFYEPENNSQFENSLNKYYYEIKKEKRSNKLSDLKNKYKLK